MNTEQIELRQHPGFEKAHLLSTGPQLGIRETRRPRSRQDVTEEDARLGRRRPDGIGRASWPIEVHETRGRARFVALGGEGFFDIPPGALVAEGIDNLFLAGRVIGCDAAALGSIRVMGTAFATGHAAGLSAVFSAGGQSASGVELRRGLLAQNAII